MQLGKRFVVNATVCTIVETNKGIAGIALSYE